MKVEPRHVSVVLLEDLGRDDARRLEAELRLVEIAPDQSGFSMGAAAVLEKSAVDPTRRTFAVLVDDAGSARAVGIGVLQPDALDHEAWPSQEPYVVLRGFCIDQREQGRGIGTTATRHAIALAERLFPDATDLVLTVHVDNVAGQRAYERCGFQRPGRQVEGRAGQEYVMYRPLLDD